MSEKLKVAVYCRLEMVNEAAMTAFVMQRNHYISFIKAQEDWEFAGIYLDYERDDKMRSQPELERLLESCAEGKVDFIITRSISRLHKNMANAVSIARKLLELPSPVGIYFEDTKMNTLDEKNDVLLSLLKFYAQEESRTKNKRLPRGQEYYHFPIKRKEAVNQ